jgi:hypothetical protein
MTRVAHCATRGTGSSWTTRQLLSSALRAQPHLPRSERRGSDFVLGGSSIAAALKARTFDGPFGTMYRKGGTQIPKELAVKFSQSKIAIERPAKQARKDAKRFLGCRSSRFICDKLGEPVTTLVSVIDDTGFRALTALREDTDLKPHKVKLRLVHAMLHKLPFWIADPVRQVLGHWFRTIRRAVRAVDHVLKEDAVLDRLCEPT